MPETWHHRQTWNGAINAKVAPVHQGSPARVISPSRIPILRSHLAGYSCLVGHHLQRASMESPRSNRILELDGLRAFAVLFVVLFHMCDFSGSIPRGPHWITNLVSCLGPSGVNVFFIISGFIITKLL